jgi:hypothetical protein
MVTDFNENNIEKNPSLKVILYNSYLETWIENNKETSPQPLP